MAKRKTKCTYYVSTEGYDEIWYLRHLQKLINENEKATKQVVIVASKSNPLQFVKQKSTGYEENFYHICDFEGKEEIETFKNNIKECDNAKKYKSLNSYNFYYTNLCFELWMILHKVNFTAHISKKEKYLDYINKYYKVKIKSFDKLKTEDNFQTLLDKIELADVLFAIKGAETLVRANESAGCHYDRINNVRFCQDDPDLNLHEFVKLILKDVGLL